MTAPFTASNGYKVITAEAHGASIFDVVSPDRRYLSGTVAYSPEMLQALVEYAATIGITAPSEEESA